MNRQPTVADAMASLRADGLIPKTVIQIGRHALTTNWIDANPEAHNLMLLHGVRSLDWIDANYAGRSYELLTPLIEELTELDHFIRKRPFASPAYVILNVEAVAEDVLLGAREILARTIALFVTVTPDTWTEIARTAESKGLIFREPVDLAYYDNGLLKRAVLVFSRQHT